MCDIRIYTGMESKMSNISELKINALPSKTWYWLNLNDTRVAWDSKTVPCNIETDGYTFHKSGTSQSERDIKKDRILELYGIPLVRLSTIGSNEKKIIGDKLSEVYYKA